MDGCLSEAEKGAECGMKLSERTIIDKVFQGISDNGWHVYNGIGMGTHQNDASYKSAVKPLVDYLRKKGIEVS